MEVAASAELAVSVEDDDEEKDAAADVVGGSLTFTVSDIFAASHIFRFLVSS